MNPRHWWDERVVPRLVDVALSDRVADRWRRSVCEESTGTVLEVGFGSGLNLPHYGAAVTEVLAVEPSDLAWQRAQERIGSFGRPVERIGLDGARLPTPDASVDTVVSTWTMCTIADLDRALSEFRRVLKPDGKFRFVEHSLAPTERVRRVQHRLQPVWGRVAGGCHLDRDIPGLVNAAGFDTGGLRETYAATFALARPFGWFVSGAVTAG